MKTTIHDLRRAILNGGDISSFAEVYHHVLGDPPAGIISNFNLPMVLPQPLSLLANMDKQLSVVTTRIKNEQENSRTSLSQIDLRIAAVSTYGNNAGKYLERIIKETNPDVVAVGACPVELGAHILYACSLPYAVGLPLRTHITHIGSRQTYANSFFYPNSTIETALIESWLHGIPVFPIGYPLKPIQLEFDPWGGHFDPDYADKNTWESKQYVANAVFEENVKGDFGLQDAKR